MAPNRAPNETMARKYKLGAMAVSMFDSQYAKHDPHFTMSKQVKFDPYSNVQYIKCLITTKTR